MDPAASLPAPPQLANPASDPTIVWIQDGGCEGCTMSVLGATVPRLEEVLDGTLTGRPVSLVHPIVSLDAGGAYLAKLDAAARGALNPFLLVVEGSVLDGPQAGDGSFSGLGERDGHRITIGEWIARLASEAAVVVAIGTCAASGGIPAAAGNTTGARGVISFLGDDFVSRSGLPVVNVPGCAPSGDAFVEVIMYVLFHLEGRVPLDLDEHNRPRWLYAQTTPVQPWASDGNARVESPLEAACPVPARGWINRLGGCASVGGTCSGCTRPDYPDAVLHVSARTGR